MEVYFAALSQEIKEKGARYPFSVDNIYVGGGTPSLAAKYLPALGDTIRRAFSVKKDAEISMECNPESVTPSFLRAAKEFGVNRVSVGVQSLSDPLLKRIGRAHDSARALEALDLLTGSFPSVGADIMVGLPGQSAEDLLSTLDGLLAFPLDHLSCYSLILEKGTLLYREARRGAFHPDDEVAVDLYDLATEKLADSGFCRYEISNYCRNDAVCRYNASVWQYGDYLGLGLGASSFIKAKSFPAFRFKNTSDLARYLSFGGTPRGRREKIFAEEGAREFVMLGLRLTEGMSLSRFRELFSCDFDEVFPGKREALSRYLGSAGDRLFIKPEYLYVSNSIISEIIF